MLLRRQKSLEAAEPALQAWPATPAAYLAYRPLCQTLVRTQVPLHYPVTVPQKPLSPPIESHPIRRQQRVA